MFSLHVDLKSYDANRAWDNILDKVSEIADNLSDTDVADALFDNVGIHLSWIPGDDV